MRSSARKRWAVLATSLWVTAQGAGLLHAVEETHRICPEHGDLLHDSGSTSAQAGTFPGVQARQVSESDGHEHCQILAHAVQGLLDREGATFCIDGELAEAAPAGVILPSTPLRFAPKQSPPAA